MTSIKTFENSKRQNLEKDVNKFLEGYENCHNKREPKYLHSELITDLSSISYYTRKNIPSKTSITLN